MTGTGETSSKTSTETPSEISSEAPGDTPGRLALDVKGLDVSIHPSGSAPVRPVRGVDIAVARNEVVGLVGESGSGKTMLSRAVAGLLAPGLKPELAGRIVVNGTDLSAAGAGGRRAALRTELSYVFQDPNAHLNPTMRIGRQISEAIRPGGRGVEELLAAVGLPATEEFARRHPHQLSGGMKQRIIIACALAKRPALVIADEPTTALDVTIQDQVLRLLRSLADQEHVGVLLVSHDLAAIGQFCQRVFVMFEGEIVEHGPTEDVLWRPRHEYTRSLMAAMHEIYDIAGAPAPGARSASAELRREP